MITINITREGDLDHFGKITDAFIRSSLKLSSSAIELNNVIINLILTDNKFIHTINRDYRKKDRPTDVISFAYRDEPFPQMEGKKEVLGDIFLSLEQAQIQSIEYGVTFKEECNRLLVHSLLHLVGYDHERSKYAERIMRKKEDELLSIISIK